MKAGSAIGITVRFKHTYVTATSRPFMLNVDLKLPGQGVTAIFGQSGSGKTTLLRCIAGLQSVDYGELVVNGATWQSGRNTLPTHKRSLGYVFQESSLFAHLTAQGNLNYAIKRSGNRQMRERYRQVVALMGIEPVLQQYPDQLSGGEKQRVAIARSLLIDPHILLMDEPLASLDSQRKREILPYLEGLRQEFALPIIYVSHALDEVARLADYLVVLDQGRAVAHGPTDDVLSRLDLPVRLGEDVGVVMRATVAERQSDWHLIRAAFEGGELWLSDGGDAVGQAIRLRILARDVSLSLTSQQDSSILNRLAAQIIDIKPDEDQAMDLVRLKVGATVLIARVTRFSVDRLELVVGRWVWAQIKSVAIAR